jgi:amidase
MVPIALGTQTKGSVLRPASYCGVTGFKASYGLFPMDGVLPLAKSLDTLGFFTPTPDDMFALWTSLGHAAGVEEDLPVGIPESLSGVEPVMAAAFQGAIGRLRDAGITVETIDLSDMLAGLCDANDTVMNYEGARFHEQRYNQYGDRLDQLAVLVRTGLQISEHRYEEAKRYIDVCKARIAELYTVTPVIAVPAATGPAPHGLGWTGDARMNAPWTTLGTPAISIPMPVTDGLPLGLQLTAGHGEDARVLRTAGRVHRLISNLTSVDSRGGRL